MPSFPHVTTDTGVWEAAELPELDRWPWVHPLRIILCVCQANHMETDASTETSSPPSSCPVCFCGMTPGQDVWRCEQCQSQYHLVCILQWTLRTVLNHGQRPRVFTCPACRRPHPISSLPGFHSEASVQPASTTTTAAPAIMSLISTMIPTPSLAGVLLERQRHHRMRTRSQQRQQAAAERSEEAAQEEDEEDMEDDDDDDDDDDEEDVSSSRHNVFNIKTRTLTVNIHSFQIDSSSGGGADEDS